MMAVAERIDLTEFMINQDKPEGNNKYGWGAGSQLEALRYYLSNKVEILYKFKEDDYQGDCFALLKFDNIFVLWRDNFGSCSGCDGLEYANGYEYIMSTLQEGNTRQFNTLKEVVDYLEQTNDYLWSKWKDQKDIITKEELK